jgi:hypothetical protein
MSSKLERTPHDEYLEKFKTILTTNKILKTLTELVQDLDDIDLEEFTENQKQEIKNIEQTVLSSKTHSKKVMESIRELMDYINDGLNIYLEEKVNGEEQVPETYSADESLFFTLPPEIQNLILSNLQDQDFRRFNSVSKYYQRELAKNPDKKPSYQILNRKYIENKKQYEDALRTAEKRNKFKELFLRITYGKQSNFEEIIFLNKRLGDIKRKYINNPNKFTGLINRIEEFLKFPMYMYNENESMFKIQHLVDNQEFLDLLHQYEMKTHMYKYH